MSIFGIHKNLDYVLFKYIKGASRLILRSTNRYYRALSDQHLTIMDYLETVPRRMKFFLESPTYTGLFFLERILLQNATTYSMYGFRPTVQEKCFDVHHFDLLTTNCEFDRKSHKITGSTFIFTPLYSNPQHFIHWKHTYSGQYDLYNLLLKKYGKEPDPWFVQSTQYLGEKVLFFVRFPITMVHEIRETCVTLFYNDVHGRWSNNVNDEVDWDVSEFSGEVYASVWGENNPMFISREAFRNLLLFNN